MIERCEVRRMTEDIDIDTSNVLRALSRVVNSNRICRHEAGNENNDYEGVFLPYMKEAVDDFCKEAATLKKDFDKLGL